MGVREGDGDAGEHGKGASFLAPCPSIRLYGRVEGAFPIVCAVSDRDPMQCGGKQSRHATSTKPYHIEFHESNIPTLALAPSISRSAPRQRQLGLIKRLDKTRQEVVCCGAPARCASWSARHQSSSPCLLTCPALLCAPPRVGGCLDVLAQPPEALAVALTHDDGAHEELNRADVLEGDLALSDPGGGARKWGKGQPR